MRTTITLDDQLFNDAAAIVGDQNASTVVKKALQAYVQTAAAKRLMTLGGSAPGFTIPKRSQRADLIAAEEQADYQANSKKP